LKAEINERDGRRDLNAFGALGIDHAASQAEDAEFSSQCGDEIEI